MMEDSVKLFYLSIYSYNSYKIENCDVKTSTALRSITLMLQN